MKARKASLTKHLSFLSRAGFAKEATIRWAMSLGTTVVGATATRSLAVQQGKVEHLPIGELEVGRLRVRELAVEEKRSEPQPFKALKGHKYFNLTTFRKSGETVHIPVWFALVDDSIYATTPPNSGKMKRIRNEPRVVLTPPNARGRPRGESVAQIIDGTAPERATLALHDKYRLGLAMFHLFGKRSVGRVTLEVCPLGADAEGA